MVGGRPVFLLVVWSQDVSPRGPFQAVTLMSVQREKLLQLFSMVNRQASKLTEVGFKSFLFNSYKRELRNTISPLENNLAMSGAIKLTLPLETVLKKLPMIRERETLCHKTIWDGWDYEFIKINIWVYFDVLLSILYIEWSIFFLWLDILGIRLLNINGYM